MAPVDLANGASVVQTGSRPLAAIPATTAQLLSQYVAGGNLGWFSPLQYGRALPHAIDDIEGDLGDDIYLKMSWDSQISACLSIFKAGILEGGLDLQPAITDETDPEYDLSKNLADEATAMFDNLTTSLDDVLWDMLSCLQFGSKVAELIFEIQPGVTENRPMLHLAAIKPRPRHATAFVVDAYSNVFGMLIRAPMQASPFLGTSTFDPANPPENFLPREKFAILSFRPVDGDIRGSSLLRSAYDPWWRKRQVYLEHLRYITQFAGPSLVGFTAKEAQPTLATDDLGNILPDVPAISPEQAMLIALQDFRNGTAIAFPNGASVQPINLSGEGAAFLRAIAESNVSITKALLTQSLATEEGEHQTRAASQVHQDVLGTLIRQGKRSMLRMIVKDILKPWAVRNWGEKILHLLPVPSLGETEQPDLALMITALASAGYQVGPSQLPDIDIMLGLPVRDPEEDAEQAAQAQQAALELHQAAQPTVGVNSSPPAGAAEPGSSTPLETPASAAAPAPAKPGTGQPALPPPGHIAVRGHNRRVRQRVGVTGLNGLNGARATRNG